MREDYSNGCTKATTPCTSTSPHGGYNGGNDLSVSLSLSLTLSLSVQLRSIHTLTKVQQHTLISVFPKSYLYIYDFWLIYISVPSNRSGRIGTGSSVIRFSLTSIRRDLFPNTCKTFLMYVCLPFLPNGTLPMCRIGCVVSSPISTYPGRSGSRSS